LATVPSIYLDEFADLASALEVLEKWPQKKFVVKPVIGAGSKGLHVFDNNTALPNLQSVFNSNKDTWFIQPFIDSVTWGECSAFFLNGRHSHSILKTPKAGDFRSQEEFGSRIVARQPKDNEISFCQNVLETLGEDLLYARIDYLIIDEQPHLIELELIEPCLYFGTYPQAAENFVTAWIERFES